MRASERDGSPRRRAEQSSRCCAYLALASLALLLGVLKRLGANGKDVATLRERALLRLHSAVLQFLLEGRRLRRRPLQRRLQRRLLRRKAGRRWWPPGVEVRPSTIKGAGDGLFALRQFVTGEVLGDYSGERRNFLWMLQNENTGYVMCFGLNDYVDACVAFDCPGRYVNDTFDGRRNARFVRASGRAQVVAIKPIAAGEEVFASYGDQYWESRGVNPHTGEPAAPGGEVAEGLRVLEEVRARAAASPTLSSDTSAWTITERARARAAARAAARRTPLQGR